MGAYVGFNSPGPEQQMPTTFSISGNFQGVTSVVVQVFQFDTTNDDLKQVGSDLPTTLTFQGGGGGTFTTASITLPANTTSSPNYVAIASGYITPGNTTTAAVAIPVRFTCVSGGRSGGPCPEDGPTLASAGRASRAAPKKKSAAKKAARKKSKAKKTRRRK